MGSSLFEEEHAADRNFVSASQNAKHQTIRVVNVHQTHSLDIRLIGPVLRMRKATTYQAVRQNADLNCFSSAATCRALQSDKTM